MNDTWWVDPKDLDDEQSSIIDLPIGKSHLIFGPPGSGKSNLLLLRANYVYLAGHRNIQIIVFTRTLQEFIAAGGAQYDFPATKVKTSTKFFLDLLFQYGIRVSLPDKFAERRRVLVGEVQSLISSKQLKSVYDTIFLDEAQDYWPEEIEIFRKVCKQFFAVADSRQKIYKGDDSIKALEESVDEVRTLQFHYRIGRKICKVADLLMKDSELHIAMAPGSQYDEDANPSNVDPVECSSIQEQGAKIVESLRRQLKAYPNELLGVLCPTHDVLNEIKGLIGETDLADVTTMQGDGDTINFADDRRILVATIHAGKGLEFRAVHLPGMEALAKFPLQKNMAFTAVTRAKTLVSIYHTNVLPGYLDDALQGVRAPKELPTIKRVFGAKKK